MLLDAVTAESFAIIDREIGAHTWSPAEYAIVRRAIHATADFELKTRFRFSSGAIAVGVQALKTQVPVIVDVRMVAVGIASGLAPFQTQTLCALDYPGEGLTRTAAGMKTLAHQYPHGLFVVGNAPTALLTLVDAVKAGQLHPALIIGVPVGFVAVEAAKEALAQIPVPQIQVVGRKGGSAIAAAIVNALAALAVEREPTYQLT
jgi:precorrin-8X/cobalt-precorrin-8 methylmutase